MYTVKDLYDLEHTYPEAKAYLEGFTYPWEALAGIKALILKIGASLPEDEFDHPAEDVWFAKDATVFPTAYIAGPCVIGHKTEVRQCAFVRGSALVGNGCVVGNSTELKNVILFDSVQVPHFNYVGDSILGYKAHMGAGSITSNVKSDRSYIAVKSGEVPSCAVAAEGRGVPGRPPGWNEAPGRRPEKTIVFFKLKLDMRSKSCYSIIEMLYNHINKTKKAQVKPCHS